MNKIIWNISIVNLLIDINSTCSGIKYENKNDIFKQIPHSVNMINSCQIISIKTIILKSLIKKSHLI